MFAAVRAPRSPVDRTLAALPAGYRVAERGSEHVVVGATGAFVLTAPSPDVGSAVDRVSGTAQRLRDQLARSLSWAPFVDALVVTDGDVFPSDDVGLVPARHLLHVLTDGSPLLSEGDIDAITAVVQELPIPPATKH